MPIPKDTIEQIRHLADIVEIVGETVALKKTGNHFSGLCPFHREKTPSFKVFPESQNFHCFGCGEGGTVFDFLMKIENVGFPEAVAQLGRRVGVEVAGTEADAGEDRLLAELGETMELAARYYESRLRSEAGAHARRYLADRGFSLDSLPAFRLGYATGSWDGLIIALRRFRDVAALERAGLTIAGSRGPYDRFRDRIMFPIFSTAGRVVAFGARSLGDGEPKYLNSPEGPLYHKGRVLYGLYQARAAIRERRQVLVVEGYADVLGVQRGGIRNVVATCGTALTAEHAQILARSAPEVVLVFDGDAAGVRAALKGFETLLPSGARVRAAALPEGRDPDEIVRDEGAERFTALLAESRDVVEFFFDRSRGEPKPAALERLARLIALVPQPIARREMAARAADRFRFDEATFAREIERLVKGDRPGAARKVRAAERAPRKLEADLLRICLRDPAFWQEIEELMARPELERLIAAQVRPEVRRLLARVHAEGRALPPSAHRDACDDPAVRDFLMELAAQGAPDASQLFREKRDLVGSLPRMALEAEVVRLRGELRRAEERQDRTIEEKLLARLKDVTGRLDRLGRAEEAPQTH
jgi:DNA primase